MKDKTYNLGELCREADVTVRTVRYYIKEGLLPPPHGSGPFSRYGYEHWLRLQFIKRLKDEYLPLSEIKNLLDSRSTGELAQLAHQAGIIPYSGNSPEEQPGALAQTSESLRNLIGGGSARNRLLREQMAPSAWSAPPVLSDSFEAMPQSKMESYEAGAAPEQSFSTYAFSSDSDVDAFTDVPETYNLTPVPSPSGSLETAKNADLPDVEPEESSAPTPPPMYGAPGQAKRAFSAQTFRAGAAPSGAAGGAPGGASAGSSASKASGNQPVSGVNNNIPVPAAPLRAMRMSRLAASDIESDSASDTANENTGRFSPEKINASRMASPAPVLPVPAPVPMMARMVPAASAEPPPVSQPESPAEIVTGQTWERIEVAPGVELHIEKRIADTHRPALANLLQVARRLFGPKEI